MLRGGAPQGDPKECSESSPPADRHLQPSAQHLPLLPSAESPCLGEVVRDVIRRQKGSASCATASKVPVMECRGGCGPQCCQPTRSKRRKYVFQCTDGSSFVEEVERHLECGCRPCS